MTVAGWRARIGYLRPTYHGNDFQLWLETAPSGVSFTPAIIGYVGTSREEFMSGLDRSRELATDLVAKGCDSIIVIGTPPFLLIGPEEERRWADRLRSDLGVPVVTAMLPHAEALRALGCRDVLAVTYYGGVLNTALREYFGKCGLRVTDIAGYTVPSPRVRDPGELQTSSHDELNTVDFTEVYRHARAAFLSCDGPVDAIYINGSGWNAEPAVAELERDLGVPVVWAQHAVSWFAYRTLHINNAGGNVCRLYDLWPALPEPKNG